MGRGRARPERPVRCGFCTTARRARSDARSSSRVSLACSIYPLRSSGLIIVLLECRRLARLSDAQEVPCRPPGELCPALALARPSSVSFPWPCIEFLRSFPMSEMRFCSAPHHRFGTRLAFVQGRRFGPASALAQDAAALRPLPTLLQLLHFRHAPPQTFVLLLTPLVLDAHARVRLSRTT